MNKADRYEPRGVAPLSAALTLLLLPGLALAPVLPALHLTLASHAHRFCIEHQRFEDVVVDPQAEAPAIAARDEDAEPAPDAQGQISTQLPDATRYVVCAIANLTAGSTLLTRAPAPGRDGITTALTAPATAELTFGPGWVLAQAPKQSPPLSA